MHSASVVLGAAKQSPLRRDLIPVRNRSRGLSPFGRGNGPRGPKGTVILFGRENRARNMAIRPQPVNRCLVLRRTGTAAFSSPVNGY